MQAEDIKATQNPDTEAESRSRSPERTNGRSESRRTAER